MPKEKLFAQARDELFSHINRCGVLSATDDDRTTWMTETIDYIGERYPDLVAPDLQELHEVGIRFCQPAINNVPAAVVSEPAAEAATVDASADASVDKPVDGSVDAPVDAPEEVEVAEPPLPPTSAAGTDSEATKEQDGGANAA